MEPKVTVEFENTILDSSFIAAAKDAHNRWLENLLIDPYNYNDYGVKGNKDMNQETKEYYTPKVKKEIIQVEDYVIASRDKKDKGVITFLASKPWVYHSYREAIETAEKNAVAYPDKEFIVLGVVAVTSVKTINTSYKL